MDAIVAVVEARPETVLEDLARALALAGLDGGDDQDPVGTVCLEHAAGAGWCWPAVASPPWQVEGVLRGLRAAGQPLADLRVLAPVSARQDREAVALWRCALAGFAGATLTIGDRPSGVQAPLLLLAGLRTDRRLALSGCLGTLAQHLRPAERRPSPAWRPPALVEAWRRLGPQAVRGAVLDATVGGAGPAPSVLQPVAGHLLLAGRDPVAVDAIAALLAGLAPADLPLVQTAAAAGFGCADPRRIVLAGDAGDGLPSLDLAARLRPRGAGGFLDMVAGVWGASIGRSGAPGFLQSRRWRRQYEATPWGRLQRQYVRRDPADGEGGP